MNVSIDINVPKLIEWLISRRHCQKDWQKDVSLIRTKINNALLDMPEHKDIASLLSGAYLNYFHCLKILNILQETEADSKNIFGRYSSKRMKDWNEIIALYQKNNVYLAEAADILISTTKYDIPNLKKQIAKQKQLENELKKKEQEAIKGGASMQAELNSFLKELGLSKDLSTGFKAGLLETTQGLSITHDKIAKKTQELSNAIKHYEGFSKNTQPQADIDMSVVSYLADKGNTTLFEYEKGEKPTKIILPTISVEEEDSSNEYDTIDWGLPSSDNVQIEVVGSGDAELSDVPVDSKSDGTTATGDLAYSILDASITRVKFINCLLELKAFLKLRIMESHLETGLTAVSESEASLQKMLTAVDSINTLLNNPTTHHQYFLTHSPRYLEDLLKKIKQKESIIERCSAVAEVSKDRAKETIQETAKFNSQIRISTQKCSELQSQIAEEISKKYNGRPVYLIGGV